MSAHASNAGPLGPDPLGGLDMRVILVGRTGLDQKLRLDPRFELVRVKTPLEALGELATPTPDAPADAVVVLGPDAHPGAGPRAGEPMDEFLKGVRAVDPKARVLAVAIDHTRGDPLLAAALDGLIYADSPAEELGRTIRDARPLPETKPLPRGEEPSEERTGADVGLDDAATALEFAVPRSAPPPAQSAPPSTQGASRSAESPHGIPPESALVGAMVRGQDVLTLALEQARRTLRDHTLSYDALPTPVTDEPQRVRVPVVWDTRVLGTLSAVKTDVALLQPWAAWLAGWIVLRDQHAQLRRAAFTDPLTGAWNRRYFDRFLTAALHTARDQRHAVTVLVFDIDNFKHYNDAFGHDAGDEILRETVKLLRSVIRPSDRVCRIGGDEFAVIFHEPEGPRDKASRHPSNIFEIAKRFQQQVRTHKFPKLGESAPGTLTISGGLATYPWDGTTPEALLCRADELALQSKRQGKNAITYGPGATGAGFDTPR